MAVGGARAFGIWCGLLLEEQRRSRGETLPPKLEGALRDFSIASLPAAMGDRHDLTPEQDYARLKAIFDASRHKP